ncbi:MAG: hypothetical protein AAF830_10500 [Pseudomonadota bacterium]
MDSLLVYLAFIALSLGGVWVLLDRLGLGEEAQPSELDAERTLYEHNLPNGDGAISTDNARLYDLSGHVGVVRAHGHRLLTRIIRPQEVRSVERTKRGVAVRLRDFGEPAVLLITDEPDGVMDWLRARLMSDTIHGPSPLGELRAKSFDEWVGA